MIPFFAPSLPPIASNQYLSQIDNNGWYSNFGPLVKTFEQRLNQHFRIDGDGVITLSNGTLALMGVLSCLNLPKDARVLVPSWTFAATPLSAKILGYDVVFSDVDADTWALTPTIAYDVCEKERINAVIPVCPFGRPLDVKAWEVFQMVTNIPVIIDAAAAFANVTPSIIPQMISLHPTKIFSSGEGGLIVCLDEAFNQRLRRWSNFSFDHTRTAIDIGTNAKMNEYNAAIGLASLDAWPSIYQNFQTLSQIYKDFIDTIPFISIQDGFGENWISSSVMLKSHFLQGDDIIQNLNQAGVEARRWWGKPCHQHPALQEDLHLPVTNHLFQQLFSIPFHLKMKDAEINYLFQFLRSTLQQMQPSIKQQEIVLE